MPRPMATGGLVVMGALLRSGAIRGSSQNSQNNYNWNERDFYF